MLIILTKGSEKRIVDITFIAGLDKLFNKQSNNRRLLETMKLLLRHCNVEIGI